MKRAELKRKAPLQPKRRPRKCRVCGEAYTPRSTTQKACSPQCALQLAGKERERRQKAEEQAKRRQTRELRERMKTLSQLTKEAQAAFNWFIRERDHAEPCICCGKWGPDEAWKPGGSFDAGHYLSRGSHPELRFNEDNCHKQLKSCNAGSGKYAGKNRTVGKAYRKRLIRKIGLERVEWLEGPHEPRRYRHDELREIRDRYRALARRLKKEREDEMQD